MREVHLLPALIGHLIYGMVTALALVGVSYDLYRDNGSFGITRGSLVRGSLAGLMSGALMTWALNSQLGSPAVSASMMDNSRPTAFATSLVVGLVAGLGYAVLYPRATNGSGPALIRGMAYGFALWVTMALTIVPLLDGEGLRWSVEDVQANFETFPGYLLVLGSVLSIVYQWLTALSRSLFSDDVVERAQEGIGTQGLRAIVRGAVAGLIGGLLFTIVMLQIGFLSTVASLIGQESSVVGFLVHLVVANIIGVGYGLLFVRQSNDTGSALGWGVAYGVLWWLTGPLTMLPLLLGDTPRWTVEAAADAYPALIGHMAYGLVLGLVFFRLESRHNPWWVTRNEAEAARAQRASDQLLGSAPALWILTIVIALTIPVLLAP